MTVLSASYGADIRLVALMRYLRVASVALSSALVARLFGVQHMTEASVEWFPTMPLTGLTLALAAILAFGGN